MSRLTLCVIARDEEAMLPDCLASAAGAVDEIVVVDTGSRDQTRAVAERFGAKVVNHTWRDDFAAARNAALPFVKSGYLLILDADERLSRKAAKVLRAAARRGVIDLGLLPLHNASRVDAEPGEVLDGSARSGEPIALPRFVRKTDDLRWEGIIHESLAEWLIRGKRRVEHLKAPIVHYGAIESVRAARDKDSRNLRLLEQRCLADPGDPAAWALLCAEHRRAGAGDSALDAGWRAWRALEQARETGSTHHDVVLPASLLGHLLVDCGNPREAKEILEQAQRFGAEHPNIYLLEGLCHEHIVVNLGGDASGLGAAAECYRRCLANDGQPFVAELMPGATSWQASTRLGVVQLLTERPEDAKSSFEFALERKPDHSDALLGRAEAMLDLGEPAIALSELEPLVQDGSVDAWLLASEAALELGALDDARMFLETARNQRSSGGSFATPHRHRRLVALERRMPSREDRAPTRVIAWPRYDDVSDLTLLLRDYAKQIVGKREVILYLRHDPAVDGPADRAISMLEDAYARHITEDAPLEVLLLDDETTAENLAILAGPTDVAIELPGSVDDRRRAYLERLRSRRVSSPDQLRGALAGAPSSNT